MNKKLLFSFLISLLAFANAKSQATAWTDTFLQGVPATTTQINTWNAFRASLTPGSYCAMWIGGTFNTAGISCNNAPEVNAYATALQNYTSYTTPSCLGNVWSLCNRYDGEVWLNPPSECSGANCPNGYIIRPGIGTGNPNWGGVNTQTCSGPNQRMSLIFFSSFPNPAGAITGPTAACANTTQTYSTTPIFGALSYLWTAPVGATILTGQGTTTVTIQFGANSGNVSVAGVNPCGPGTATNLAVTISPSAPLQPGTISGSASVCENSTGTYSISAVTNATGYNWTVPVGATINSGQNTTSINVTFGTTSGNITVTANNSCGTSAAQTLAVTVDPIPIVNAGSNQSICANTSCIALNGTSSTGSGIWSTSGTGTFVPNNTTLNACYTPSPADISAGTVSLTLTSTNNGACSAASQTIIITINAQPTVALGADITQCGGTVTLDAQNAGSTYLWSDASTTQTIVVSTTGNYSVVVTDVNGCTGTDVIVVTINTLPTVTLTLSPSLVCITWPSYLLTGGSPSGGTYSGTGVSANMFDPNAAGQGTFTITYVYTDVNGCIDSAQQTITVDLCTGVPTTNDLQTVTIYPNPSSGNFTLQMNGDGLTQVNVSVFDVAGKEVFVYSQNVSNNTFSKNINLENLAQGVYQLEVITNLGVKTEQVVIQR